jgi:hypothetical protein
MELGNISPKNCNELEQTITHLLKVMRNSKLNDSALYGELQALEQALGDLRRTRYDEKNSKFVGY